MTVEVHLGTERRVVGTAQDNADKRADMRGALRRVDEMVADGFLSVRGEAKWRFQTEYSAVEDWREFVERPTCGGLEADTRLIDAALARPDGRVTVTEDNLAVVYERLLPGSGP